VNPTTDDMAQFEQLSHLRSLNADFSVDDVLTLLSKLSHKTSVGPDGIPFALLRNGGKALATVLCRLINFSWHHSVIPQAWRDADVIALYKGKGDLEDCDSYRPISLTSVLARTVERLIYPRLYAIINQHLSIHQSGFRHGRSTVDQILAVVERARLSIAAKECLPVVFLDIKKAFDRVWHDGLMFKLYDQFRVAGRCWSWIRAFLFGRRLRVRLNGLLSGWHDVENGVPQGSVLAPLLFLVYINDLASQVEAVGCESSLFADDGALMPKLPSDFTSLVLRGTAHHRVPYRARPDSTLRDALQSGLEVTHRWSVMWRMEWGIKKCALVVYHNRRTRSPDHNWSLSLGDEILSRSDHYLYLGVILHEKLTWKPHFAQVHRKSEFMCWKLCRWIRSAERLGRVGLPVVRQLVLACVRSCFGYALPIWRPTQSHIQKLQRCILTPLRHVLHLPRTTSSIGILVECAIPDVHTWIQHLALRMARRVNLLPDIHPAKICFAYWYNKSITHNTALSARYLSYLPFGRLIKAIEWRWFGVDELTFAGVDDEYPLCLHYHDKSLSLTTDQLLRRCYSDAVNNGRCSHLRSIKQQHGLSPYLRTDNRTVAAHRARLRLNRAKLNLSLWQRNLTYEFFCDRSACIPSPPEGVTHLLLHCPAYNTARRRLCDILHSHNLQLTVPLALGEWDTNTGKNREVMNALRHFIIEVHAIRDF
jgi:hypothetical protein